MNSRLNERTGAKEFFVTSDDGDRIYGIFSDKEKADRILIKLKKKLVDLKDHRALRLAQKSST